MSSHIFVIDDDPSILEVTTLILEEEGYQVSALRSEKELFTLLQEQTPDLILMDVWLGETDGKTITQRLRSQKETQEVPVVLFSALGDIEKITKEAGANGFLRKPFDVVQLLQVVEDIVAA